jgi:formylglycine-generating enzyme required for sulfatase activity
MRDTDRAAPSYFKGANCPVEQVSWNDIDQLFLPRLNNQTIAQRPEGTFYRLPTEAEWEYAARGGKYWQKYPFEYTGSNKLEEVGWYYENSHSGTKAVGLKTSNLLGLYDMSGNVWEWCSDWSGSYKNLSESILINPKDLKYGTYRVLRGGSWSNLKKNCLSMNRNFDLPTLDLNDFGFRLVLSFSAVQ